MTRSEDIDVPPRVIDIKCPSCDAAPGEHCSSIFGRVGFHFKRIEKAREHDVGS